MIGLRILAYEEHGENEWVIVSYRRWWWPFRTTRTLFSGEGYKAENFTDEHGKYVKSHNCRDLLTRYLAEQEKMTKLLEAHDLPEKTKPEHAKEPVASWQGPLRRDRDSLSFEPENWSGFHFWQIHTNSHVLNGIPSSWVGGRVRITMEKLP